MVKKLLIVILFSVALGFVNPIFSHASENNITLKMAWHECENYQEIDKYGNPSGYIGEYINEMESVTGIHFELVYAGWEESFELLKKGEVDLLCGASYTKERDADFDYVMPSVLKYYYNIATLKENKGNYTGYKSLDGKKVGILKGTVAYELFVELYPKADFTSVYFEDINGMVKALKSGEIDYILQINKFSNDENIVEVDTFKDTDAFFIVKNGDFDTNNILSEAINTVESENSNFNENLFNKYFSPNGENLYLSLEEKEALKNLGVFKVYLDEKTRYYNYMENGRIRGITPDFARLIANELGLTLEMEYVNTGEIIRNQTPCFIADMPNDYKWATSFYGCSNMTKPYFEKNFYLVKRNEYIIEEDNEVKAVCSNNRVYYSYCPYVSKDIKLIGSTESVLEKISLGTADIGIIDAIEKNYWDDGYKYYDLQYSHIPYNYEVCFGAVGDYDKDVISAINKVIEIKLPNEENRIIEMNLLEGVYEATFFERLNANPIMLSVIVFILALLSFLAFLYLYVSNTNRELLRANLKAEKANVAKSEFLARMSHDMRTPMNAVIAFSNFGIEEARNETDVKYFKQIKESSNYLMGLLNDVLDMQKIESGSITLKKTIIKEDEFLDGIKGIVIPRANEKGIIMEFKEAKNSPKFSKIDVQRTTQIYVNLLSNAIKYTPNGGKVVWESEYFSNNGRPYFLIKISDNGVGMSEEFQNKMYEPFTMEESDRENIDLGGTGLGLSITKKLVEAIGGEINCKSKLNKGTVFTLKMPTELATEYEYYSQRENIEYDEMAALKGLSILICEDNIINQKVLSKMLEGYDFEMDFANDGLIGINKAKRKKYDFILMDIRMPNLDGLLATKEIRKFDTKVPIIALSANAYAEDVEKSIDAGMNAHIAKPIDKDELINTLAELRSK
jgi:signal transduction histidine kinase/ABC-type amino acid transport substrate-binding protein